MNNLFKLISNSAAMLIIDIILISLSWISAYLIRFDFEYLPNLTEPKTLILLIYVNAIQWSSFYKFGCHKTIWKYAGLTDVMKLCKAILSASSFIVLGLFIVDRADNLARSIIALYFFTSMSIIIGSRFVYRYYLEVIRPEFTKKSRRTLIIGAGQAANQILRDIHNDKEKKYQPIVLVDDDQTKYKKEIRGIKVLGTTNDIAAICKRLNIAQIIIAIPSIKSQQLQNIIEICDKTNLPVSTLPSLSNLISGKNFTSMLHSLSLEELLGRAPYTLDWQKIKENISNKVILITGAGGSIGSEVCRQIAKLNPQAICAIDSCEFNLFNLEQEISSTFPKIKLTSLLIDIRDKASIKWCFTKFKPDIIFHAAAYKHVPLLQHQIREAISTNIIGTHNIAEHALICKIPKMILVSTDKAVNPENIMGATKRVAEMICQSFDQQTSQTRFITVRFGNVLGSAGSVVPIFKKQIETGGPVTVTHPDITRYFMTIPEASKLILQALSLGEGGEIFVLDMGKAVKITYLAEKLIKLMGKTPDKDIKIIYTGLRAGEKLYEELFYHNEQLQPTTHSKIMYAKARSFNYQQLTIKLRAMEQACQEYNEDQLFAMINELVPEISQMNKLTNEKISSMTTEQA